MRLNGDLNLLGKMFNLTLGEEDVLENSAPGSIRFKDGQILLCLSVNGAPMWLPLLNQSNTHFHTQDLTRTEWIIEHELNSAQTLIQITDLTGKHIYPDEIEEEHNRTTVRFHTAQAGRALLMVGQDIGTPRPDVAYQEDFEESTTWTINHFLGYEPTIRVFIDKFEVRPESIQHTSLNTSVITFNEPRAGQVRCA